MSFRAIIKKWYVILMCAVLCAGGLYYEKSKVVPAVPQTGDMTYIRVVKFNQIPVESLNDTNVEIKLDPLVKAWPNLSELSKQMNSQLDMKKFNPKWGEMPESKRFGWLTGHYRINRIGPGMYELIFQMKRTEAKDQKYIADNHVKLLDVYEDFFRRSASMVASDTSLTTVKEFGLVEDAGTPKPKQVESKYAIIGFVLGALVGVVIVMVWDAGKRYARR